MTAGTLLSTHLTWYASMLESFIYDTIDYKR